MSLPDLGYIPTAAHLRDKSRERIKELEAKVASQRAEIHELRNILGVAQNQLHVLRAERMLTEGRR